MNSKRTRIAFVGCTLAAVTAGGCRSSMPGLNMFGSNREPSAETLAGTGPTTTYPVPPSANAKPQAIDSIAADVSGPKASESGPTTGTKAASPSAAQVAGMNFGGGDVDMGATADIAASAGIGASAAAATSQKSSAANLAAAQANGFNPGGVATPASATGSGGGSATGFTGASPATKPAGIAPSYDMPSMASMTSKPASAPSTTSSIAPPPGTSMPTSKPSDGSIGYTLPPGLDPGSSERGSANGSEPNDAPMSTPEMETKVAGSEPKAAAEPEAKVATRPDRDGGSGGSSDGTVSGGTSSGFASPAGTYAPGSTSGESAYPSSPSPSGGSIYR